MPQPLPIASSWEMLLVYLKRRRYVRVINESMIPTLYPGDVVVLNEHAYRRRPPQPGDVVVAEHPEGGHSALGHPRLIKRIDSVRMDEAMGNRYFLTSDNAALPESRDSRNYGEFSTQSIVGKVMGKLPST